ncbi:hypothetical protein [Kribbella sp. CA-293567]|uniref:hypothetical protein n=1 Tax=Kribbella sp. CA-293567 TaxID=3002436 RepID=UPI0022DE06D6|nr:hypothetical protein [Kribbella sp. CA-293567]WBQ07363.1 hypothetical protein OX958_11295 [Kribbella sp. CA-293567]
MKAHELAGRRGQTDARLLTAGRLIAVGFATGLIAGAVAGGVLAYDANDPDQWWLTGASFGAMIGSMLGVLVQLLNLVLLAVSARVHGTPNRWWVAPLPIVASVLAVPTLADRLDASAGSTVVAGILAAAVTIVSVVVFTKWCTRPLAHAGV